MNTKGKEEQWQIFSDIVAKHIREYTIPQYGDTGDDLATDYSFEDCMRAIKKYIARAGKNVRPDQDELDCLKIAHYAQMAYNILHTETNHAQD